MPTREETAKMLAEHWYDNDEDVQAVYRLLSNSEEDLEEPVKLLIVDSSVERLAEYSRVMPLFFSAHPESDLYYPYSVGVVSPEEIQRVATGELSLPEGWRLAEKMPNTTLSSKAAA